MLRVEKTEVFNLHGAVRGMRNPLNSWDKSDSRWETVSDYKIGESDLALMRKLYRAGTEHRKYLRQIFVCMDIIAPLYWWKEADQYRVGITTNSCSTMHKLLSKPFEMDDFSYDNLPGYKNEIRQFVPEVDDDMAAEEQWVAYDQEYEASDCGRIRHKLKNGYRILGGSKHKDGYIFVTLHGKQIPLHRIIAMLFCKDGYEEGLVVNHIDGNKQNNFANNLEWVTQRENILHSHANNLQPVPTKTYMGKFSTEERMKIKKMWEDGLMSRREIAKQYGVSHTCINDIVNDKYKYVESVNVYEEAARPLVDMLNELRDAWIIEEDETKKKRIWYSIIQLLPSSYNQRRTVTMNYENVVTIIRQRTGHKLSEWSQLIAVLKGLPYVKEIMYEAD